MSRVSKVRIGGVALAVFSACLHLGCDDSAKRPIPLEPPRPAAPASSIAEALGVDASALVIEPADPPPPSGNLRDELEHFSTVDACVKERGRLDPILGDAMLAVGYETFTRDACRVLDALKAREAKRCNGITSGALERHCLSLVAIARQNPDECPWENERFKSSGRLPFCVAAAAHDPRLCAAELRASRVSCEALVQHDEKRCDVLLESERAECKRKAVRFQSLVEAPDSKLVPIPKPEATVSFTAIGDTKPLAAPTADAALDVARGIVLTEERDGTHVLLGSLEYDSPTSLPSSAMRRARAAFEVVVDKVGTAKVSRAELDVPGDTPLLCPGTACDVRVIVKKLERVRGGAVSIEVAGKVGVSPKAFDVKWSGSTFVRDVASSAAAAGPSSVLFGGSKPPATLAPPPSPAVSR